MKVYSQEEVLDATIGKIGTPQRDEYERTVKSYLDCLAIRKSGKIIDESQYNVVVNRVEELLPLVDENTPTTDPDFTELVELSNIVADYSDKHYQV